METPGDDVPLSPTPFSPNASRQSVRYRRSCDNCQKIKVRCSQRQPACKNCFRRAIPCIYSPVRRMGRPKKTSNQLDRSQETTYENCNDGLGPRTDFLSGSDGPSVSSSNIAVSRSSGTTTNATTITTPSSAGNPTTRQITLETWDSGRSGRIDAGLNPAVHSPNSFAQTLSNPFEPSWINPLHAFQANDTTASNASLVDHDYIAVLTALAALEHSVATGPPTPSVELAFRAESDFRALKDRIVVRCNHASHGDPPVFPPANSRALLMLSLLSERVVSILEGKFRSTISTMSAQTIDPDVSGQAQDHELPGIASFIGPGNQETAVVRSPAGYSAHFEASSTSLVCFRSLAGSPKYDSVPMNSPCRRQRERSRRSCKLGFGKWWLHFWICGKSCQGRYECRSMLLMGFWIGEIVT